MTHHDERFAHIRELERRHRHLQIAFGAFVGLTMAAGFYLVLLIADLIGRR